MTNAKSTELETENASLRARIAQLEQQIEFMHQHPLLLRGLQGEILISCIVAGTLTAYATMHDVDTANGIKIEVKHAKPTLSNKVRGQHRRWQWNKLFGESGKKEFDFVLLIGDIDERYRNSYKEPDSPYVLFCIPSTELFPLTIKGQRDGYRKLDLNTNSRGKLQHSGRTLYQRYQITTDDLRTKFGIV